MVGPAAKENAENATDQLCAGGEFAGAQIVREQNSTSDRCKAFARSAHEPCARHAAARSVDIRVPELVP